jgi:NADH:ubiquinone oxidoreductase subunit K
LLVRAWGYIGTLLLVECLWVVLYSMFVLSARYTYELSFFMIAILILVLSAVELVVGLLCFIIYYHAFNSLSTTTPQSKTAATSSYTSAARLRISRFSWAASNSKYPLP